MRSFQGSLESAGDALLTSPGSESFKDEPDHAKATGEQNMGRSGYSREPNPSSALLSAELGVSSGTQSPLIH